MFKQFLISLKQNLREEDNLSTRDKWPVPKVSSVRRFYCIWTWEGPGDERLYSGIALMRENGSVPFMNDVIVIVFCHSCSVG